MLRMFILAVLYFGTAQGSPVQTYCPRSPPPDYHSADTDDCQVFYKCWQGVWVRQRCQLNLHFDIVSNTCNWPSESDCLMNLAMSGGTRHCAPCMGCLNTMKCPSISKLAMTLAASIGIQPCKPCLHWLHMMRQHKMSKSAMFFAMMVGNHACKPCVHWLKMMKCEIVSTPVKCPVRCHPAGGVCNTDNATQAVCDCLPGWKGVACSEDVDECADQPSLCNGDPNQFCTNTPGSYQCSCIPGYILDVSSGRCAPACPVACSPVGGTCDYSRSVCTCKPGYEGVDCSSDIDECTQQASVCSFSPNQVCVNTPGSYTCECDTDFVRDTSTGLCVTCPVQCSQVGGVCDRVNAQCNCRPGYKGVACSEDIDECADQPTLCGGSTDLNQFCVNTPGSYTCNCTAGYTLIAGRCVTCPVPCSSIGGVCDRVNSRCECKPGYTGQACTEDIDECSVNPTICMLGSHKHCLNTPGSYLCQCVHGFTQTVRDGNCIDIDECAQQPTLCSNLPNTECVNTQGNYTCQCVNGYTLDTVSGNCVVSGVCPVLCYTKGGVCDRINRKCDCLPGYRGPGCFEDVDECTLPGVCGDQGRCTNSHGSYTCLCATGYTVSDVTKKCVQEDIDECASQPLLCSSDPNSRCVNTIGSYICQCVSGFTRDLITGQCVADSCEQTPSCSSYPCLVFEDEFNTLDLQTWEHEITAGGAANLEFQYYTNNRSNSYVRDGKLFIKPTLTSERYGESFLTSGQLNLWGSTPADTCTGAHYSGCEVKGQPGQVVNPIQSARLRTARSFNFRYGRLEVEAKMATGDWLWPVISLLPRYESYGPWPASGEIDLVESRGNLNLRNIQGREVGVSTVSSTLHFGPYPELDDWTKTNAQIARAPQFGTFGDSFHKYRMDWNDTAISFYVDDRPILTVDPGTGGFWTLGQFDLKGQGNLDNPWTGRGKMAPFDQDFYISMNVAVGGRRQFYDGMFNSQYVKPWRDYSGHAPTDFWNARNLWLPTWKDEDAAMQVNYVKVWKLSSEQ